VYCGDLNVAFCEVDIKNAKSNIGNPGYSYEERGKLGELFGAGFTDTFRYMHPDLVKYSWWSYRFKARENNTGWRIDYFLVSDEMKNRVKRADILTDIMGSDHCPVLLEI
jgi:exodeoxyribonuclease-3